MNKQQILISTKKEVCTAIDAVLSELEYAEDKHQQFPVDIIHRAAILNEEAGELTQACIDHVYMNKPLDEAIKEAAQVGAMAIRFLVSVQRFEKIGVIKI